MYKIFLVIFVNVSLGLCRPQAVSQNHSTISTITPIAIISSTEFFAPNGSFNYAFQTANGINISQSGYTKHISSDDVNANGTREYESDILVIHGSYSYTAPEGVLINITYIADQNGFQPEGDSLPSKTTGISSSSLSGGVGATSLSSSSIKTTTTTPIPIIPNPPNA